MLFHCTDMPCLAFATRSSLRPGYVLRYYTLPLPSLSPLCHSDSPQSDAILRLRSAAMGSANPLHNLPTQCLCFLGEALPLLCGSQQNSALAALTEQILCYPRIAFAELFYATPCHRFGSPCPAIAEPLTAIPCPCLALPGLAVAILTIQCRSYPVLCSAPAPSCFAIASSRPTLPLPFDPKQIRC